MKKYSFYLFILGIAAMAWSCDSKSMANNESNLPRASTAPNEILVVMDSTNWEGNIGAELREIFSAPIAGLPQEEAAFKLSHTSPRHFKGFMKHYPNIIFVTTLDDRSSDSRVMQSYFTENSLQQIRENPDLFMFTRHNEYARGQEVLHLFAQNEAKLLGKLETNKSRLHSYFIEFERQRLSKKLFSGLPNKKLSNYVEKKHGFRMEFPVGYEVAIEGDQFIWIRQLDQKEDKSIWIAYQDYQSEDVFEQDNILKLRQQFAGSYIFGNDSTTYMKTEPDVPVHKREFNFKDRFAVETRGLWRLNKMLMGGPFVSYTFVDEESNRLYYIEGFTYAPGEKKRGPVRELEAILHTFKTQSSKQSQQPPTAALGGEKEQLVSGTSLAQ